VLFFFFFKQKTAYEITGCDWSSDVCSSDLSNLKKICEENFPDDYDLEVIDIYENPTAAREAQIIAAPTLVKKLPEPLRKFVGDLSNTQKILVGLDVYKRQETGELPRA